MNRFLLLACFAFYYLPLDAQVLVGKNIRWEVPAALQDPRYELFFGSGGRSMGSESITLALKNKSTETIYIKMEVTVTDGCGVEKTFPFSRTALPGKTSGSSFFLEGVEYNPACTVNRKISEDKITRIASVQFRLIAVKYSGGGKNPGGGTGNMPPAGGGNNNPPPSGNPAPTLPGSNGNPPNTGNIQCIPLNPGTKSIGYGCVSLMWALPTPTMMADKDGNVRSYEYDKQFILEWRMKGSLLWQQKKAGGYYLNVATIEGLEPCTEYEMRLTTLCSQRPSLTGDVVWFRTACAGINNLQVTVLSGGKASINVRRSALPVTCDDPLPPADVQVRYRPANSGQWLYKRWPWKSGAPLLDMLKLNAQYEIQGAVIFQNGKSSEFSRISYFTVPPR